jgi:hypothetical protein
VLFEYNYGGGGVRYLPEFLDFKEGKLYPNKRPGIGVKVDFDQVKLITEITEADRRRQMYYRPDGSITNW